VDSRLRGDKSKTLKLVFAATLLSTHYLKVRSKTVMLGIMAMCLNGSTCLTVNYCLSGLSL